MSSATEVNRIDDWLKLIERGLTTVVDPMVFRAGEVFLRGRSGKGVGSMLPRDVNEKESWSFLDKNLLALGFFFDALILNERLPLFDYSDTFDRHLTFEDRVFAVFNDAEGSVIEPVHVDFGQYDEIKQRALKRLRDKFEQREQAGWLTQQEATGILDELSATEYQWNIALGQDLEAFLPTEDDRLLARFLLGGMIFGEYATRMQSEHRMQPKRAGLFAKATAGVGSPGRDDEQRLFEWLAQRYGLAALRASQPTFYNLVLSSAQSVSDIPGIIKKLRKSSAVADYRAWRTEAVYEWRTKGGLSKQSLRTPERLQQLLTKAGGMDVADAGVSLVEAVSDPTGVSAAKAAAKAAPSLFGWALDFKPGRRHVKLLATSQHARNDFPKIEEGVKRLWVTH